MKMRTAGALAGVVVAALLATGGPAQAAPADEPSDMALTVSNATVKADASFVDESTVVLNKGPGPRNGGWSIAYDLSGLDDSVVTVGATFHNGCLLDGQVLTCIELPGLALAGQSYEQPSPFKLARVPGKKGPAGSFTVTAVVDNDPDAT